VWPVRPVRNELQSPTSAQQVALATAVRDESHVVQSQVVREVVDRQVLVEVPVAEVTRPEVRDNASLIRTREGEGYRGDYGVRDECVGLARLDGPASHPPVEEDDVLEDAVHYLHHDVATGYLQTREHRRVVDVESAEVRRRLDWRGIPSYVDAVGRNVVSRVCYLNTTPSLDLPLAVISSQNAIVDDEDPPVNNEIEDPHVQGAA
jgi:hypothetical protein